MEHEITYLDGAQVAVVTGQTSLVEAEGRVVSVVVETDGAVFFIPAKLVISWKEQPVRQCPFYCEPDHEPDTYLHV